MTGVYIWTEMPKNISFKKYKSAFSQTYTEVISSQSNDNLGVLFMI